MNTPNRVPLCDRCDARMEFTTFRQAEGMLLTYWRCPNEPHSLVADNMSGPEFRADYD